MPSRYQDAYPSAPIVRSDDHVRPLASELLSLEYFEAEPGEMPAEVFGQHHILINLNDEPHRVENWRAGEYRDFTYRRGEIVVTPAGVESGWRWHARSKVIVITLEPDKLERFAHSELGVLLTEEQLEDVPHFLDHDITDAGAMLLDALEQRIGSAVMFESLARVFLTKLIQKYGQERDEERAFSASFTARHYKRVLDFVAAHHGRRITLEEMAAEVGISPYHFARLFKRTIGQPPHQFVMAYRVEHAKKLMADPARALVDVALSCGFSDQAHFSRVFKRLSGMTPTEWRRTSA
ncbi:MAG: AraC family transcriptional regulator [Acidobacteriota bacterium]